jgi:hypothetical protein
MKLKPLLIAVAFASPLCLHTAVFAQDGAPAAKPAASAKTAHSDAKKKLAACKAEAAAKTPALDAQATKKFVQECVAKAA